MTFLSKSLTNFSKSSSSFYVHHFDLLEKLSIVVSGERLDKEELKACEQSIEVHRLRVRELTVLPRIETDSEAARLIVPPSPSPVVFA